MHLLRRHIVPFVVALMLATMAAVPLAHTWLHHGGGTLDTGAVSVVAVHAHCDLCATVFDAPPAPAPSAEVAFVDDAPAPVPVVDTGVARLLEAIGRAPPTV